MRRLFLALLFAVCPTLASAQTTLVCPPTSNVDTSDWTPSGAASVWDAINDSTLADLSDHDGNSTIATNASGFNVFLIVQRNTGTCNIPDGATAITVEPIFMARHPTGANCSTRLRVNGTNFEDFGATSVGTSFAAISDPFLVNPDGGGAWSVATANATEGYTARCEDGVIVTAAAILFHYTPAAGGGTPKGLTTLGVGDDQIELRR
jgi:hypothetical protein